MTSPQPIARLAGLGWLIIIAAGISAEVFVRASLVVPGDAVTTAGNIVASEGLFRLGIVGDLIMLLADVAVALALYALLRPVSEILALLAAFFRLVQAAILGVNLLNLVGALLLLGGAGYLEVFEPSQVQALALTALDAHAVGYDVGLVFFAFSLTVLGTLLFRSRYVPRVLAVLLSLSALVYLAGSLATILAPAYAPRLETTYVLPFIAELALALWLLIKGVDVHPRADHAPASSRPRLVPR